ncbi:MAG: DUF6285 domain-containing protein [Hyphomicrobiaceae bacterium]
MQDRPHPAILVAATADFIRREILPLTEGGRYFQLRVALNALDLVTRQLNLADDSDTGEVQRLEILLGRQGSIEDLNRALCDLIASGEITLATPGLKDHLWATTIAKLAVDQPNYASYRRTLEDEARR